LVLPENNLAYAAVSQLLLKQAALVPSVVFLYGPKGSGKSHLAAHLIRANLRRKRPHRHVSVSARELVTRGHEPPQSGASQEDGVRPAVDLFVCEDVHLLDDPGPSHTAARCLLESVLESSARVLLTSRVPAGQLPGLSNRLVNRCHAGIHVAISSLAYSSRVALLNYFARNRQIAATSAACEELAKKLATSPGDLLDALIELDAFARRQNGEITADLVLLYLQSRSMRRRLGTSEVVEAVARQFGVTVKELRSRSRTEGLALPRECAMYLARELTGSPFEKISRFFNGRSHSTAIHAYGRFQSRLAAHPELERRLAEIRQKLVEGS
jgi:chromosomal replication initiator protein